MSPAPTVTTGQLKALLVTLTIVLTVTFALSYKGLYDYGQRVAHFGFLSPLVPVGVDGGQICAIYAIHALRKMSYGKRLYAWIVFLLFAGSSVAANAAHALFQGYVTAGVIGAAGTAAAGALLTHLVIFVKRHLQVTQEDNRPDISQDKTDDTTINKSPLEANVTQDIRRDISWDKPNDKQRTKNRATQHDKTGKRQVALQKLSTGQLIKTVAEDLGVDKRTVSRWKAAAGSKNLSSPLTI